MANMITDRPLYLAVNYIYVIAVTNFHFILANILFLLAFIFSDLTMENILLFYITLLPTGPSLAALFATMGKYVREKEVRPTIDFWIYYKKNFKPAFLYWIITSTALMVLFIDIYYAEGFLAFFTPFFFVLCIGIFVILIYALPILTRFEVKQKNLWVVSFYSIFRFIKTTILNITTILSLALIYYIAPGTIVWFFMSLAAYFIMFNMRKPFEIMELELTDQNKTASGG
ncbi:YesL family protein [Saliterribacillus persicus]|uniref:Putative membrane protein YesL n=1 Tax=Saliterribacillus persicus TaxID=930114 RepID=A0A368Y3L0_9BACI|nr:DUF624 domain-containing protein [Saliterribacillus persicus]RCW74772.1 putative membrane protein YesL [Saliterribacillus persicus]